MLKFDMDKIYTIKDYTGKIIFSKENENGNIISIRGIHNGIYSIYDLKNIIQEDIKECNDYWIIDGNFEDLLKHHLFKKDYLYNCQIMGAIVLGEIMNCQIHNISHSFLFKSHSNIYSLDTFQLSEKRFIEYDKNECPSIIRIQKVLDEKDLDLVSQDLFNDIIVMHLINDVNDNVKMILDENCNIHIGDDILIECFKDGLINIELEDKNFLVVDAENFANKNFDSAFADKYLEKFYINNEWGDDSR